jgi:H/ACA ribonucleoprotein complex subunit 2
MAKEKKEKKDKSSKKSKIEEPVADKSTRVGKKDKKEKKSAISEDAASALLDTIVTEAKVAEVVVGFSAPGAVAEASSNELVPFALPLAQEKETKKVLKCVKKGRFYDSMDEV